MESALQVLYPDEFKSISEEIELYTQLLNCTNLIKDMKQDRANSELMGQYHTGKERVAAWERKNNESLVILESEKKVLLEKVKQFRV